MKLNQPFSWMGSKCRLRGRLYDIFRDIPRALYVEPFGGSGAVFFGKPAENSVYNDCNRLLTNFFTVIRSAEKRAQIQELARYTPTNQIHFYELRDLCLDFLAGKDCENHRQKLNLGDYPADVCAAFAFFYVQNNGFGGKCCNWFGRATALKDDSARFLPRTYHDRADALALFADKMRLTQVITADWRDVLRDYDAPTTFFYIDPPYECGATKDYKTPWTSDDTRELVAACLTLRGSWVLSCYDGELYEPLLQVATRQQFEALQSVCKTARDKSIETVYIKNNLKTLF